MTKGLTLLVQEKGNKLREMTTTGLRMGIRVVSETEGFSGRHSTEIVDFRSASFFHVF